MSADKCRPVEVDGETIRVHGIRKMTPEEVDGFAEIVRAAKRLMTVRSCPDCEQGKHRNCTGEAWDNDVDDFAPCPCGDLIHGSRSRDAREQANP